MADTSDKIIIGLIGVMRFGFDYGYPVRARTAGCMLKSSSPNSIFEEGFQALTSDC